MKLSNEMIYFLDGFLSVFEIAQIKANKKNVYNLLNNCQYDRFFDELSNPKEGQECQYCDYIEAHDHFTEFNETCPGCGAYNEFWTRYIDHLGNVFDDDGKYIFNIDE